MPLTDSACKSAKPAAKPRKMSDGGGLYLLVKPTGQRYWRQKYSFLGKENVVAIGTYPLVSLAEAREAREYNKKLLKRGINPNEAKRDDKRQAVRSVRNTFKVTALEWHEANKSKWSEKYAETVLHRLEQYLFPDLGNRPLTAIKASDVLDTLRKIEKRGTLDVAGRARQICAKVFQYGIQLDRCASNPADALKGTLQTQKTKHFAAIDSKELPELVRTIHRNEARLYAQTRNALLLLMLTFVRPGELRQAKWQEIDLETATWTIPAERMKMRRDHIVPLSRQAVALLRKQRDETEATKSEWVLPGHKTWKEPISQSTLVVALKRLGYKDRMTAHGFRALARTTIHEQLDVAPEVIEAQLAHLAAGPLAEAYNRAQYLVKRRVMMQAWADYIDEVTTGGKIIHAHFSQIKRRG